MAFTVTFRSANPPPTAEAVAAWLIERGEPFSVEEGGVLALLALPLRLVTAPQHPHLQGHIDVVAQAPLTRIVDTLDDVSLRAGADLRLSTDGSGPRDVSRPELWMLLADEQDRVRIAAALKQAREHGDADEVHRRLWAMIASLRPGRDDRWDAGLERVVELRETGGTEPAAEGEPRTGEIVMLPVDGFVHCLVWRWLSEAYPRLAT